MVFAAGNMQAPVVIVNGSLRLIDAVEIHIEFGQGIIIRLFFLFKQKTAYEILRSDWSSDVCSSDLPNRVLLRCKPTPAWCWSGCMTTPTAVLAAAGWRSNRAWSRNRTEIIPIGDLHNHLSCSAARSIPNKATRHTSIDTERRSCWPTTRKMALRSPRLPACGLPRRLHRLALFTRAATGTSLWRWWMTESPTPPGSRPKGRTAVEWTSWALAATTAKAIPSRVPAVDCTARRPTPARSSSHLLTAFAGWKPTET